MSSLSYGIQNEYYNFIGVTTDSKLNPTTSVPVTLTGAFADNRVARTIGGNSECSLYVEYTPGQDNGAFELLVETSADKVDNSPVFYQDISTALSSGVATISQQSYAFTGATSGVTYRFRILLPVADKVLRVSVRDRAATKGTATVRLLSSGRT